MVAYVPHVLLEYMSVLTARGLHAVPCVSRTGLFDSKKHRLWPLSRGVTDPSMYPNLGHRATAGSSESDHEPSVLRRVQDKYVTVALTVAFLLYSTISTLIFQVRG